MPPQSPRTGPGGALNALNTFLHHPLVAPVTGSFFWSATCVAATLGVVEAIGPARCQIIYATGPLWAALMAYFLLAEPSSSQRSFTPPLG